MDATKPQIAKDGDVWANLCEAHDGEMDRTLSSLDAAKMLRAWIHAQGGARAAADRMNAERHAHGQ